MQTYTYSFKKSGYGVFVSSIKLPFLRSENIVYLLPFSLISKVNYVRY